MKLSTAVISQVASQAALNRNPNGKEDIVYTPLQAEIFELNGLGKIPEILINRDTNESDELTPKILEKQFGSNFRAELDRQKEDQKKNGKGFMNGVTIDGTFGGTWRIIRDINGIWHVPMFYGEGQVWADKSRDIPFWGDQANVVMSGKDMIKKIQQEFERASCLTVDLYDDEAAVLSYFNSLDTNPMYDTTNGAFIHPSYANPADRSKMSRLKALNGSGCWSYVGRVFENNQEISFIDEWCAGGVEPGLHETMHALGFHHEQSRYDRDSKIWIDQNVCPNASLFSALLYKAPRHAWPDMLNQWGRQHDYTSIMHYESWVCSAQNTDHTTDGTLGSSDGKDWKRYGYLTNTGEYLPTESSLFKRFEMSDIAQINEIYNCNDRSNDHYFKTFMLYCDNNPELAYPVGWRCDGSCDCSDDSSDCSDEANCNIVQKSGTGGTLGGGIGSLATGDWINLDQLKAMSVGVRTDRDGTVGYPCSKYGYRIVDDGSGIKCECAPWAGNGSQWGADVDLTIQGNNCDSVHPDQCTNECSGITDANCSLDNTKFNGVDCCTDTDTEYNIVNGACVERNRCEDGTHHCMSEAYGGVCTWTTNVGYTCGCRRGYNGQGCSYRAFQENEGGCESDWEDILIGVDVSQFPYYSTCRTNENVCTSGGPEGHDCVASATCAKIEERYSKGLMGGTYTCTCPQGETGDGKLSGTGCSGDVCFNDPTLCPTLDNLGNTISTCVANSDGTHNCICPDTHTGDATEDGSCVLKVDECAAGTHDCGANQICIDQESLFTCDCFINFETYGFSKTGSYETGDLVCSDVNECDTLTMPCAPRNSVCTNQVPSECDASQDVGQCTSFSSFFDPIYGQNCPINAFCNTHTCACSTGFVSTDMIMFLDSGSVTFTGIDCDTPEEYNNCAVTGDGTGCVDPFCDNQCSDAPCVDTGPLSYNSELEGYARGYICDCRSIDMFGDGIGGCTMATCPSNSSPIDSTATVFHSNSFPAVVEDWNCACDEGFILSESDLGDPKNPVCVVDPCVALTCDTTTSECSRISDTEAICSCLSGFQPVNGQTNVCEDVDECTEGTHDCPSVTTACVNNAGSFDCEPILDCNCDRKPANGPDAESLCQEVGKKTIKMLFTCPSNPSNFRLFSGKCKKVSKAKAFSMPQPCGQLNCSCGSAVAALAAERAAHVQCWSAAKKPTYRMFCDTNANGVWDSGESRRDSKIKCRNDGSLKRHSFGNFSC